MDTTLVYLPTRERIKSGPGCFSRDFKQGKLQTSTYNPLLQAIYAPLLCNQVVYTLHHIGSHSVLFWCIGQPGIKQKVNRVNLAEELSKGAYSGYCGTPLVINLRPLASQIGSIHSPSYRLSFGISEVYWAIWYQIKSGPGYNNRTSNYIISSLT